MEAASDVWTEIQAAEFFLLKFLRKIRFFVMTTIQGARNDCHPNVKLHSIFPTRDPLVLEAVPLISSEDRS